MKLVSKSWQEIKDDKNITEKYEYLSLRDRELYASLRKCWREDIQQVQEDSDVNTLKMVLKSRDKDSKRSKNVSVVSDQKLAGLGTILEENEDEGSGGHGRDVKS